uniref:Integrator complex subunit 10 n=1 Tax=Oreochromis niloticus TaxID=8128 RepID=A0A669ENR7_ORENI
MSAQKDCEFLVKRARELVSDDPCAAKAWLITARTLYPADFNIQYEMYIIERNAEKTASAGRLLYDMFINFPDQPIVWREISVITLLEVVSGLVPPNQEPPKTPEDQVRVKPKTRKGNDLRLLPCTSKSVLPFCLQLMLACFKLRAFTDSRDDLSLGHVVVLLQYDWPQGEMLFLKAVDKICQQGSFQYENFFNYVTNIDMLEEFAYLRTPEGGRIQLELLPNQGMLIKHHTVTRGITKGVKEDFRLAMERQVSRCGENLLAVLHRFCINEKIIIIQSLP